MLLSLIWVSLTSFAEKNFRSSPLMNLELLDLDLDSFLFRQSPCDCDHLESFSSVLDYLPDLGHRLEPKIVFDPGILLVENRLDHFVPFISREARASRPLLSRGAGAPRLKIPKGAKKRF